MQNYNTDNFSKLLSESSHIGIISHESPDGDSIGSSVATYCILKSMGKEPVVFIPDEIPGNLLWLLEGVDYCVYTNSISQADNKLNDLELVVGLDQNALRRCGKLGESVKELLDSGVPSVMIDHHLDPTDDYQVQFSFPDKCSTAQLVYEIFFEMTEFNELEEQFANAVYTGILTDTGGFRFDSVDSNTHRIVANLMDYNGLHQSAIHERLFDNITLNKLKAQSIVFGQQLRISNGGEVAAIYWDYDNEKTITLKKGDTDAWVNLALAIEGVKTAAFFRPKDSESCKISFRSKGDIAVNELAGNYFNGGGHKNASGGRYFGTIEQAISTFEDKVKEIL